MKTTENAPIKNSEALTTHEKPQFLEAKTERSVSPSIFPWGHELLVTIYSLKRTSSHP
jgi:hypothetical protein